MEEKDVRSEGQAESASSAGPSESDAKGDAEATTEQILHELGEVAAKVIEVVKVAWNSEERKQIEADLKKGISTVASELEAGLRKVTETEPAKEVVNRAENVAGSVGEKVRASKVTSDLADGLAKGLRAISVQLEKWMEEMNKKQAAAGETGSGEAAPSSAPQAESSPQDIPIDRS